MSLGIDFTLPRDYVAGSGEALVRLSQGYTAIVDLEDLDWISQYGWSVQVDYRCGQAYAARWISNGKFSKGKRYLHREIAKTPDGLFTDHWNGDGLDCRRINLRTVSSGWNGQNRGRSRERRGVDFMRGRWRARIQVKSKRIELGMFATVEEAMSAYDAAALFWYGPQALTNKRAADGPPAFAFGVPEPLPFE